MEFINPVVFVPAMLTSSSVPENDYAAWNAGAAYAVSARCIFDHHIYECLIAHTGAQPDSNTAAPTPKWLDLGATNRFAAFDKKWGTQTKGLNTLTLVLTPGVVVDSLALLNVKGRRVEISCSVGGSVKYTRVISLQTSIGVRNWRQYFLADIVAKTDVLLTDLLPYGKQVITITVTGSGTVAIGTISFGKLVNLGPSMYGLGFGITDYTPKETDKFGNLSIGEERPYSKRYTVKFAIENIYLDQVALLLASVRSRAVVWIGVREYSSFITLGYYKDFEIDLPYETLSYCSMTIEGLAS